MKTDSKYRSTKYQYGIETILRVDDQAYNYYSTLANSFNNIQLSCILDKLLAQRGRSDEFCLKAIKDIFSLCIKDEVIADYIYNMPPPSFQFTRYIEWFELYLRDVKEDNIKAQ